MKKKIIISSICIVIFLLLVAGIYFYLKSDRLTRTEEEKKQAEKIESHFDIKLPNNTRILSYQDTLAEEEYTGSLFVILQIPMLEEKKFFKQFPNDSKDKDIEGEYEATYSLILPIAEDRKEIYKVSTTVPFGAHGKINVKKRGIKDRIVYMWYYE